MALRRDASSGGRSGAGLRFLRVLRDKLYGPTGIGILYVKEALLQRCRRGKGAVL